MPFQLPDTASKEGNKPAARPPGNPPKLDEASLELGHSAAEIAAVMISNSAKTIAEQFKVPRNPVQTLENNINKIYQGLLYDPFSSLREKQWPSGEPEQKIKTEIKYLVSKLAETFFVKNKFSSIEKNLIASQILANGSDDKDGLIGKWIHESLEFPLRLIGSGGSKSRATFSEWLAKTSQLPSQWSKGFVSYEERPRDDDRDLPIAPSPLNLQAAFNPLAKHYFFNLDQVKIDNILKIAQNSVVHLGGATGFLIDRNGLTVTAGHVVDGMLYSRTTANRRQSLSGDLKFEIIYSNSGDRFKEEFDAAVIRVPSFQDRVPLKIRITPISPTEPLILVGRPKSDREKNDTSPRNSPLRFSVGTLFEISKEYTPESTKDLRRHVLTDNENRGGNSGGPLLDMQGRVVGILVSHERLSVADSMHSKWTIDAAISVPASEILRILKTKGISLAQ